MTDAVEGAIEAFKESREWAEAEAERERIRQAAERIFGVEK
jgi:hypothetical protein